jgi:hypothetical protein
MLWGEMVRLRAEICCACKLVKELNPGANRRHTPPGLNPNKLRAAKSIFDFRRLFKGIIGLQDVSPETMFVL